MRRAAFALLALAAFRPACAAETLYVEAGMVLPVDGDPIPHGRIVVRDGAIAEVGADVQRPPFSTLVDARGLTVTPGFVVPQSSIGLPVATRQPSRPGQPVRVSTAARAKGADELYPLHPDYALLLQHGVTTLGLLPVSLDAGVRGQLSAISTRAADAKGMTLEAEAAVLVDVEAHGPWREKVGEAFRKAAESASEKPKSEGGDEKARRGRGGNAKKDPLLRAVKKELPLMLLLDGGSTWTAARDAIPLEDTELVVLDYGRTWELAAELHEAGARVVTEPVLVNRPRSRMPVNRAAEFERAEVPFAFRLPSDDVEGAAVLRDQAIEMVRTGASRDAVLAALTLEAARALGVAKSVGAIAKGRRADLLFWTGHPLEPLSRLERVYVGGTEIERLEEASLDDTTAPGGGA